MALFHHANDRLNTGQSSNFDPVVRITGNNECYDAGGSLFGTQTDANGTSMFIFGNVSFGTISAAVPRGDFYTKLAVIKSISFCLLECFPVRFIVFPESSFESFTRQQRFTKLRNLASIFPALDCQPVWGHSLESWLNLASS